MLYSSTVCFIDLRFRESYSMMCELTGGVWQRKDPAEYRVIRSYCKVASHKVRVEKYSRPDNWYAHFISVFELEFLSGKFDRLASKRSGFTVLLLLQ